MSRKKIVVPLIFFTLMATLALVFRPLTPAPVENTLKANGTISQVIKTGSNDVVLTLQGDPHLYYLDEGAIMATNTPMLNQQLAGQDVEIYYVKHWISLGKLQHIARLDVNKTVVYSRLRQ